MRNCSTSSSGLTAKGCVRLLRDAGDRVAMGRAERAPDGRERGRGSSTTRLRKRYYRARTPVMLFLVSRAHAGCVTVLFLVSRAHAGHAVSPPKALEAPQRNARGAEAPQRNARGSPAKRPGSPAKRPGSPTKRPGHHRVT